MIRLLIPLVVGILAAHSVDYRPLFFPWLLSVLAVTVGILAILRVAPGKAGWLFGVVLCGWLFAFAFWRTTHRHPLNDQWHFRNSGHTEAMDSLWIGRVDQMTPTTNWWRIRLRLQYNAHSREATSGDLLLYLPKEGIEAIPTVGYRLIVRGTPRRIQPPANPETPDFASIFHFQRLHYQLFLRDSADWQILPAARLGLRHRAEAWRQWALDRLERQLPTTSFSIVSALMLGWKSELSDHTRALYADTGAMHVLAVSGLHVGLVAGAVQGLLAWLLPGEDRRRYLRLIVAVAAIWAFALLTGLAPSVCRAGLMFSLWLIGRATGRRTYAYNSLAAAAVVLLIIDPLLLFQLGFQLSFAAVFGILAFQSALASLIQTASIPVKRLWDLTTVGLAAQVATLPLTLYYFHRFPLYFWLSGAPIVLNAGLLLGLGAFTLVGGSWAVIGPTSVRLLDGLIELQHWWLGWIQQLPHAVLEEIDLSLFEAFLLGGVLLIVAIARARAKGWLVALLLLTVFATCRLHERFRAARLQEILVLHDRGATEIVCRSGFLEARINQARKTDRPYLVADSALSIAMDSAGLVVLPPWKILIALPKSVERYQANLQPDVLIVNHASPWRPDELLDRFEIGKVIIDGSCGLRKSRRWQTACELRQIPHYWTKDQGAAILTNQFNHLQVHPFRSTQNDSP